MKSSHGTKQMIPCGDHSTLVGPLVFRPNIALPKVVCGKVHCYDSK
jgi:hypothetical protein